jgi:hypothetical protein
LLSPSLYIYPLAMYIMLYIWTQTLGEFDQPYHHLCPPFWMSSFLPCTVYVNSK